MLWVFIADVRACPVVSEHGNAHHLPRLLAHIQSPCIVGRSAQRARLLTPLNAGTAPRQLNKKQLAVLASDEGRAAARLSRELVTIVTDLKQPAVRWVGLGDAFWRGGV